MLFYFFLSSDGVQQCSIDALLERTFKHMLFLQGVMKHVDKQKHVGESRV